MQKTAKLLKNLKSLKFRFGAIIVVVAFISSIIIATCILMFYEMRALMLREGEVMSQARILSNQIATSEYINTKIDNDSTMILAQIDMLTNIYDGRVLIVNENCQIMYDTYNMDKDKTIISEEVINGFSGVETTSHDSENNYLEMAIPITHPNDKNNTILGVLVVSVSTSNIALNAGYLTQIAGIVIVLLLFLASFLSVLISQKMTKPFRKLSSAIACVQTGYGDESLMIRDYTETEEICKNLSEMFGRMKAMDDSRQEFVSNVSHELKTPLTSMKVLADSLNSMPDAPVELYQEFMADITTEIERETKIINDLLSLVKMDKTAAALNISTIHINELLEQILKRLQPIADRQKVKLVLESFRPVMAEIDEVKLTLAFSNLVENGIKYNRIDGEGWVHVSLNADHQYFYLKVEDSGMGIPKEDLDHIFERFYRVDKSHSREIGGTGLGLAITRSSILMHRGAIKVHSELGEGTTFDVRIPLNFIA